MPAEPQGQCTAATDEPRRDAHAAVDALLPGRRAQLQHPNRPAGRKSDRTWPRKRSNEEAKAQAVACGLVGDVDARIDRSVQHGAEARYAGSPGLRVGSPCIRCGSWKAPNTAWHHAPPRSEQSHADHALEPGRAIGIATAAPGRGGERNGRAGPFEENAEGRPGRAEAPGPPRRLEVDRRGLDERAGGAVRTSLSRTTGQTEDGKQRSSGRRESLHAGQARRYASHVRRPCWRG